MAVKGEFKLTKLQNRHVAPWDTKSLTPAKLAHFYQLVGGDYDPLFLDTPQASLSFIYQSLGCFHTLQPEKDPYSAPSIPALTPEGFVRWQTVQVLLEPEEHVQFLQEAVKRFDLVNPADGEPFPSILPKEALPSKPDLEMTQWHEAVSEKLMLEAQAANDRTMPPRPSMALSDVDLDSLRPSSADSQSIESQSVIDAANYFQYPRGHTNHLRPPPSFVNLPSGSHAAPSPAAFDGPWSPIQRQNSLPGSSSHRHSPSNRRAQVPKPNRPPPRRPQTHARTPSTLSTSSCSSDSSSVTTSSASLSPSHYHTHLPHRPNQQSHRINLHGSPLQRPFSHPSVPLLSHPRQPAGSGPNHRGLNVRWQDHGSSNGWHPPTQSQSWASSERKLRSSTGSGLDRARSVGAGPTNGRYVDSWVDERRSTSYCPPPRATSWR